jgi:hypothetical protein
LDIGAVYLAWVAKDASTTEYLKQVRESGLTGVTSVAIADRRNVVEWLEGKQKELLNVAPLNGKYYSFLNNIFLIESSS